MKRRKRRWNYSGKTEHVCNNKVILFVPHFNNTLHDMMPVALRVRDQYGYQIYFAIEWVLNNETGIEECDKYGITYILVGAAQNADQKKVIKRKRGPSPGRRVLDFLIAFKKAPVVSQLSDVIWQVLYQYRMGRQAVRLIRTLNPSVVIVYRDDRPRVSTFITHIANKKEVPTVLFPSPVIYPDKGEAYLCLGKGYTVSRLGFGKRQMYFFTSLLISNLTYRWNGEDIFFLPPEAALVAYFNGIFPKSSWIRGGGKARWKAVANQNDYERLIDAGIPDNTILVTGYPPFDKFFENDRELIRSVLCTDLNIPKERFIICYAALALQKGKESHFPVTYRELRSRARFIVEVLLNISSKVHIIFKLHPRSRLDEYGFLPVNHPRLTVIRDIDLNNAIAGSDLFATHFSVGIYASVAMQKPTLTFGFQDDYAYEMVAGSLKGTYQARSRKEFMIMAKRVFHDCCSDGLKREIMAEEAKRYAICDGNSTRRFADVVYSLTENPLGDPRIGLDKVQNG